MKTRTSWNPTNLRALRQLPLAVSRRRSGGSPLWWMCPTGYEGGADASCWKHDGTQQERERKSTCISGGNGQKRACKHPEGQKEGPSAASVAGRSGSSLATE